LAGAAFAATFTGILFLRQSDVLVGKQAILVLAILLVMAPSSSLLSRRLFLNLLLLMGLAPLIWWVPEHVTGIDHGSSVLAIAGGLVAACVFAEPSLLGGVRRLVPKVRFVDLLPLAGTLLSAAALWTMLWISNGEGALSLFLTRWDYQSHFNIFEMLRQHGAVIPMIPRISPEVGWGFAEYPQGFHALVATLAELRERGVSSLELE
jgi:hypothetical protein